MSRHLERLLQIDSLLRNKQRTTNSCLAQTLEVSERTIRSDLAFLRDRFNAPLETRSSLYRFGMAFTEYSFNHRGIIRSYRGCENA